jgi:hypothetical protein
VQRHDASRPDNLPAGRVELLRVEGERGTRCVGQVDDDLVELLGAALDEGLAVADAHLQPRVAERAAVNRLQVLLRRFHHPLVQLGQHHALHGVVLEQLLDRAAVAAPDHQGPARGGMGDGPDVAHVLVVEELVPLGGLEHVVQPQDAAEHRRVEHLDLLEPRARIHDRRRRADEEAVVAADRLTRKRSRLTPVMRPHGSLKT